MYHCHCGTAAATAQGINLLCYASACDSSVHAGSRPGNEITVYYDPESIVAHLQCCTNVAIHFSVQELMCTVAVCGISALCCRVLYRPTPIYYVSGFGIDPEAQILIGTRI